METSPTFSIVTTVYNKENYIRELLKAYLNLLEICDHIKSIVIIDDCSTDSSSHVISNFIENCESNLASRFIVSKLDINSGPQLARIKGADLAQSEWIILVDADDLIYPYSVKKVCDHIVENNSNLKHISLVYGNCPETGNTVMFEHIKDMPHKNNIGSVHICTDFKYAIWQHPLMSGIFLKCQYAHMMDNTLNRAAEDILFFFELLQYSSFLYLDIDVALWRRGLPEGSRSDAHTKSVRIELIKKLFGVNVYKNTKSLRRTFNATKVRVIFSASQLRPALINRIKKTLKFSGLSLKNLVRRLL